MHIQVVKMSPQNIFIGVVRAKRAPAEKNDSHGKTPAPPASRASHLLELLRNRMIYTGLPPPRFILEVNPIIAAVTGVRYKDMYTYVYT